MYAKKLKTCFLFYQKFDVKLNKLIIIDHILTINVKNNIEYFDMHFEMITA